MNLPKSLKPQQDYAIYIYIYKYIICNIKDKYEYLIPFYNQETSYLIFFYF